MRKMTSRLVLVALALVPAALVPAGGRAQSAPPGRGAPRDAVATEVVLLRQSVERLAAVAVRSQVLAARLAAQQQQLVLEQDTIARAEDAIDAAGHRQELTRAALERVNTALANVVEDPRAELRRQMENLNGELANQDRELNRLRTRLANAEQALRNQRQSYAELDTALGSLLREVERPKP
jgi:chromosome segregation ATPase